MPLPTYRPNSKNPSKYCHFLADMKSIGQTHDLPWTFQDQGPAIRRSIRRWCAKFNPEARFSVLWDKNRHNFVVTRVWPKGYKRSPWTDRRAVKEEQPSPEDNNAC